MYLKAWNQLPEYMKSDEVRKYYDILSKRKGQLILKRVFDILLSFVLIIILALPLFFISIWIKLDSRGPVFYRQERITQYGKVFRIFKFRTMIINADKVGTLVTTANDPRITKIGTKIRKVRLDELPQLFNVLLGDMSFVGTRPEVKKYVDEYTDEMYATLLLPAGVTSLASIEFKDEDDIISQYTSKGKSIDDAYVKEVLPKKMKYNLKAISSFCFIEELGVMVNTIVKV